ncbi:ABC transporter permease [Petrotoga sp. 9PW.55.5.1]|uniref:ABC transporter permease n=1 Tax=Petrotoga sp. 9PW.55.5.1 TaxID=1308979 RepID=UPI000DD53CDC|nr:ABC transporter permease [Petrotoga sp. 9PW.55.5.1]
MNSKIIKFFSNYGTILALLVLMLIFGIMIPNFLSLGNITDILRSVSVITVIAVGFTVALSANAFNLAITGIAGLSGALTAGLMVWNLFNPIIAILISVGVGALFGFLIALFVIYFKVDDLLASLGVMFITQGLALTYTGGLNIYSKMIKPSPTGGFITAPGVIPDAFLFLGQGNIGFLPMLIIIMFAIVLLIHIFLNNTRYGRNLYSIGGNPEASYLAGIPVNLYKILAHSLSGALAAFGGILLVSRLGSAQIAETQTMLLDCVAASYIGISVLGLGKPNPFGTFIGATLVGVMINGLTMLGVSYTMQDIFKGIILLAALTISRFTSKY